MRRVTAVILGGGRGSRLFPLTQRRAKPAVGVAGKYRLIDLPISNCINSGIERIYVVTQFQSASLHRHIMQTYRFDAFSGGYVDILSAEQTMHGASWFEGTADAVRRTLRHMAYYASDQFVILSGDHLYRMDYAALVKHHRASRADITVAVYPVPRAEASRMGLLHVDATGRLDDYEEKPTDPVVIDRFRAPDGLFPPGPATAAGGERYLASMGIYVFEPRVLRDCLRDERKLDFGHEVLPAAVREYRVAAFPFSGYWQDIGTIGAFFDANIAMAQPDPPFPLYVPGWPIFTRARSLPPSRVIHSQIIDSLIVEGSDITGAVISDSVIGLRGSVRPGTHLSEVIFMGADFYDGEDFQGSHEGGGGPTADLPSEGLPLLGIGRDCRIERAIIDKNARIGDGVVVLPHPDVASADGPSFAIREGVTVIPRGAVVPSGTVI